jgi:hypothetical protein
MTGKEAFHKGYMFHSDICEYGYFSGVPCYVRYRGYFIYECLDVAIITVPVFVFSVASQYALQINAKKFFRRYRFALKIGGAGSELRLYNLDGLPVAIYIIRIYASVIARVCDDVFAIFEVWDPVLSCEIEVDEGPAASLVSKLVCRRIEEALPLPNACALSHVFVENSG